MATRGKSSLLEALTKRLHIPALSSGCSCGKSTLLKALTTRLAKPRDLHGDVRYGGLSVPEVAAAGIHLGQLVQYVNQLDEHFPFLTVRETLSFVAENSLAGADATAVEARVQEVLDLLHLNGTWVGIGRRACRKSWICCT